MKHTFYAQYTSIFGDKQTQGKKWYIPHGNDNEDKSILSWRLFYSVIMLEVISVFYNVNTSVWFLPVNFITTVIKPNHVDISMSLS